LTHLAITKLDVLDTFKEIKVCVDYKIEDCKISHFPNRLAQVALCEPVYETVPGWECSTAKCRSWDELPENAQKYLTRISELAKVKIGMISIGAKRDESILVDMQ